MVGLYDAVVVGAGHNGLVNGAYLARAGLRTLILEKNEVVGGAAITEELHPGFHFTTFSYALSHVRPQVIDELELHKHGYETYLLESTFAPTGDGRHLLLGHDTAGNVAEIARHSHSDAERYADYDADFSAIVEALAPLLDVMPPSDGADQVGRRLARLPLPLQDKASDLLEGSALGFVDRYFESELLRATLASTGIIGTSAGPDAPGSGLVMLYLSLGAQHGHRGAWSFHKGGNGGFTRVLAQAASAFGAEIRTASPVARVVTRNGRATGVALDDGTQISAEIVVSALDPRRTFGDLVASDELPPDLVDAVAAMRFEGVSAKVNFALDRLPAFPALADEGDRPFRGFVNIAPSTDFLREAFAASERGWYSSRPYIDACVQSVLDPTMAPAGKHVMSCFVQYAPYQLEGSEWEAERSAFGDVVQATLGEFFPGFDEIVLHREVVTPVDIERVTGLSEGNIYGGDPAGSPLFFARPSPEWNDYRTPIAGYYQCGSGTHPGGCVTGAPGRLAAKRILDDRAGD